MIRCKCWNNGQLGFFAALERRNFVLNQMEANGFITGSERRAAAAKPLGLVTQRRERSVDAGYFLEEVRRELIGKFGETDDAGPYSVYDGGLWVRTSLKPDFQLYAEQALRDGLVRYDSGKGWRGPIATIDPGPGWGGRLSAQNLGAGYPEWRIAVVLGKAGAAAQIGFADGTTGVLPASGAMAPKRGTATAAFNVMKAGDIIADKKIRDRFRELEAEGYGDLPVCMAKTQKSFTDNEKILGRPTGFDVTVRGLEVSAGAGFVVPLLGDMLRMPGLPEVPAAEHMKIDGAGRIEGLS